MNTTIDIAVETPVSTELLTRSAVKARLKIEHSDEDATIDGLISETRSLIENFCGLSIGEQERVVIADIDHEYRMPFPPVEDIISAEFKSDSYEASDSYELDGVFFKRFQPTVAGRWKLSYSCGYNADNVPKGLLNAWMDLIAFCYENRGEMYEGIVEIPKAIKQKLTAFTRNYGL
jgi:hypothetical protein